MMKTDTGTRAGSSNHSYYALSKQCIFITSLLCAVVRLLQPRRSHK